MKSITIYFDDPTYELLEQLSARIGEGKNSIVVESFIRHALSKYGMTPVRYTIEETINQLSSQKDNHEVNI